MLLGTVIMSLVMFRAMELYVNDYMGGGIVDKILDSTTWVHKCDVYNNGELFEADYGEGAVDPGPLPPHYWPFLLLPQPPQPATAAIASILLSSVLAAAPHCSDHRNLSC